MSHPLGTDYDPPPSDPIPPGVVKVLKAIAVIVGGVVLVTLCLGCAVLKLLPAAGCS